MQRILLILISTWALCRAGELFAQTNSLTYLDEYSDSYYPGTDFPKLTTPQWVGEEGVDAVVTLGIDDMRDTAKYEAYLRPILNRLKAIDGRAPVSIMTCQIDPNDPQLQTWIAEGLSLETHTISHPCPCLQGGDFAKAKSTYDDCVDMMFAIPGSKPVAFRFPCMDSKNTPSPRAFSEIINKTTSKGNFLQASTSVVCVFTSRDSQLPKSITLDDQGQERFERYIPFPSFVNKIENYPYPYVIGKLCWEFPCTIPDDWQAQNIQQPFNPRTVDDMVAAIDATVIKKGMANIIFHPHNWIRPDQITTVIDRVQQKYGKRVKFLTFKECIDRINTNLLLNQPLRALDGGDNGIRIVDLNQDGYLDVMIGNEKRKVTRVWQPETSSWRDTESSDTEASVQFTAAGKTGRIDMGVKFGRLSSAANASLLVNNEHDQAIYEFADEKLTRKPLPKTLASLRTSVEGVDQGVRLRDLDGDSMSEILIASENAKQIYRLGDGGTWTRQRASMPFGIVDRLGRDNGVRFVDFDGDGHDDLIVSNEEKSAIRLYDSDAGDFSRVVKGLADVPRIVRDGTNNGAWFAADHMWLQNEDTHRLADGVDRRSFSQLLRNTQPGPRSPELSLKSIEVRPGVTVELVAAEPMVMDPIAIDWGPDGKLWVVEMADYPLGLDDQGKPGGRVRFLEDTNGDGEYDSSTLFMDEIAYPTGVIAWRDGVIISAAPSIFYAADSDGDGKSDLREDLYRGFGEGNQQHRVNGFERGLDNWLYVANGDSGGTIESVATGKRIDLGGLDLRIRPKDGSLDAQAGRTQFGRHRDDHGNWFGCSNPLPVRHYVLADHYLRRNPFVAPPSAKRDIARLDNTQLFPISRVLSHWSGYKPPAPGVGHKFTSACSTIVYRDNLFGEDFVLNTFTCEPVHNAVHRRRLVPSGVTFESVRPVDESNIEFLASKDSWFRPTTVTTGPDGAIWVVDMYRLVIEHPQWIDDEREKELFLRSGHDRGRIYRVYPTGKRPRPLPRLGELDATQLVEQLGSSNGRVRDLAQHLLIELHGASVKPNLDRMVRSGDNPLARLHALCTLDGIGAISTETLTVALKDKHPTVRRHAIRISEQILAVESSEAAELLSSLEECEIDDSHVRLQLAYSLGVSLDERATRMLARLAMQSADDQHLRAAVISSLNEYNLAAFHSAISWDAATTKLFQTQIIEMAIRLNNRSFLSGLVSNLIESIELSSTKPSELNSLAEVLTAIQKRNVKLKEPLRSQVADLSLAAAKIAADTTAPNKIRVAAVRLVAASGQNAARLTDLIDATQSIDLQIAAVNAMASYETSVLLGRFRSLSPAVRAAILEAVLARESTSLVLADACTQNIIPVQAIGESFRHRMRRHGSAKVQAAAMKLFGAVDDGIDTGALMRRYRSASGIQGDAKLGQQVFTKQCSVCHQVNGIGHAVGPDLLGMKNRSPHAMLTAILNPNAAVEDKYQSYNVLTIDGVALSGIIVNESSTSIDLLMQEGKTQTILRDDIDRLQNSGTSLMPEGVEKNIPLGDMNHLLAFLVDLGPAPQTFAGNRPVTVKPSDSGSIELAATDCRIFGDQINFEPKYKNIGFWNSSSDRVEWTLTIQGSGHYEVWLDYACPHSTAGNRFNFTCGDQTLHGQIQGTRTWDDYQQVSLGTIDLPASTLSAVFRSEGDINKWLLDLRAITLRPVN